MILGAHTILYSKKAEATRAFLREVLGLDSVDAGEGWLIFALPPAEIAAHPADEGGKVEFYLMCDDIEKTRKELEKKGVTFTQPVRDYGWGLMTSFELPGFGDLGIYEPRHPMAHSRRGPTKSKAKKTPAKTATKKAAKKAAKKKRRA